ncbi:MAG: hypothetical protein HQK54_04300 [Oligoflexales bacterium]|nr:hypothetical protein [Oligoflexales bacterium]
MRKGLDQMTAWVVAVVLSLIIFSLIVFAILRQGKGGSSHVVEQPGHGGGVVIPVDNPHGEKQPVDKHQKAEENKHESTEDNKHEGTGHERKAESTDVHKNEGASSHGGEKEESAKDSHDGKKKH